MDHDRLLSGRLRARFAAPARHRAAQSLAAALSQVMATATKDAEVSGSVEPLEQGMDAFRLLRALQEELEA